jgi:hypothetical protein
LRNCESTSKRLTFVSSLKAHPTMVVSTGTQVSILTEDLLKRSRQKRA